MLLHSHTLREHLETLRSILTLLPKEKFIMTQPNKKQVALKPLSMNNAGFGPLNFKECYIVFKFV